MSTQQNRTQLPLGRRANPVVPDAVWIDVQPQVYHNNQAAINAQHEEERVRLAQREQVRRLKEFQRNVQKRVREMSGRKQVYVSSLPTIVQPSCAPVEAKNFIDVVDPAINICSLKAEQLRLEAKCRLAGKLVAALHQFTASGDLRPPGSSLDVEQDSVDEETTSGGQSDDIVALAQRNGESKEVSFKVPVTGEEGIENTYDADACCIGKPNHSNIQSHGSGNTSHICDGLVDYIRVGQEQTAISLPRNFNPIVVTTDKQLADTQTRWLCRRLYADAERQRAKQWVRLKQHAQHVERLRIDKERERAEVENEHHRQLDTKAQAKQEEKQALQLQQYKQSKKLDREARKQNKALRYSLAIKQRLRELMELNRFDLPPLCMCASSFWETNPNTCANNCPFYQNHDAYMEALDSARVYLEQHAVAGGGVSQRESLLQRSSFSFAPHNIVS